MQIICRLCDRSFNKQITNKHLRYAHGVSTAEYKERFGQDSLSSPEYRLQRSLRASGTNNPMHGRSHSAESLAMMRDKKQGQIPHNKGVKITDPDQLAKRKLAAAKREAKYRELDNHPRRGSKLTPESREKISRAVSEYAKTHSDEVRVRAKKILAAKTENGYFDRLRSETNAKRSITWGSLGYSISHHDQTMTVTHDACGSRYQRNKASAINPHLCTKCFDAISVSNAEMELREWLESVVPHEMIYQDRTVLPDGFEIDVVIPALRIGIEYNGLYWHSEEAGKSRWYHATKHNKCAEAGIRLIQIFEDEWLQRKQIVKDRLMHIFGSSQRTDRTSARQCEIISITAAEARSWHEVHHIQGRGNGTVAYGLCKDGQLRAVMDFAKPSRAKGHKNKDDGTWELTRFSVDGHIPGAASRLFKAFIRDHDPSNIVSYSDRRWNTGAVYERIGFKREGATLPNYWYVLGDKRYHRYRFRKDQLIKEGFDPSKTEQEIMRDRGYKRIWDCGHDKWIWSR